VACRSWITLAIKGIRPKIINRGVRQFPKEKTVTDEDKKEATGEAAAPAEPEAEATDQAKSEESGPTFSEAPNPLDGVSKAGKNMWESMEGKTVSMRLYIGSIIGIIVLMLLARCS